MQKRMVCSRELQWLWLHVWLGHQWITLYVERKLKMQGCNLQESGTDLKPPLLFCLLLLFQGFQMCHIWERTEPTCVGNNKKVEAVTFPSMPGCDGTNLWNQNVRHVEVKVIALMYWASKSKLENLSSLYGSMRCDVLSHTVMKKWKVIMLL